jgi:hypothetical protein
MKKPIGSYAEYAKASKINSSLPCKYVNRVLQTPVYFKLRYLPIRPVLINKLQEIFVFLIEILLH